MDAADGLRSVFAPHRVAVIGASRRDGSIGRAILANLRSHGFAGTLYAVNPHTDVIDGVPCVPSITQLQVDLSVVAVPAACVEQVIAECAAAGVRAAIIVTSGFAEASEAGRRAQDRVLQIARDAGMRVVGPNCLGVIDTRSRLDASFAPTFPPAGNVAIASQSGAIAIALIDQAAARGLGIASVVSLGNRMDVSSNDLVEYWAEDPGIAVIALYLESFGNPRRFPDIARRASRRKPIVVLKSGRSAVGMRAASSHSAALATNDVGVDGLLASAGVMRVETMEELFDVVELLSAQPPPRGSRVGIVTNAGGPGILLADACAAHGLTTPQLTDATRTELRACLPSAAAVDNPVDLTASAPAEQFAHAVELVGRDPGVDALVATYIPPYVTRPEDIAQAVASGAARVARERPVAAVFMMPGAAPAALCRGGRGCIPSYMFPENVAGALAKAAAYGRWRDRPAGTSFELPARAVAEIRRIIDRQSDGWMSSWDVIALLAAAGVRSAGTECCAVELDEVVHAAECLGYPSSSRPSRRTWSTRPTSGA
jgi:acetyltransferase